MSNLCEIECKWRSFQQLKALTIGFEHRVLNPIVNHFDEMTSAIGTHMRVAAFRRQGLEYRPKPFDDFGFAADHHAIADLESPDAAAGSSVDEIQTLRSQFLRPANGIFVIGISTVDENVALGEVGQE